MTPPRRVPALLFCALAAALSACASARLGGGWDSSAPPHWRRPGPAADGPIERRVVPDDGFADHLAAAASTGGGLSSARA